MTEAYAFPLSYGQQRLWFLDQLIPGNPFYNTSVPLRMAVPIDAAVLERSINEIVRRHEVLRTSFANIGERPLQIIKESLHVPLVAHDLSHLRPPERDAQVLELATEQAGLPFDLSRGPLIRTCLLRLADSEYLFVLTMHHIITDGWSMGIFFKEMNALYGAFISGASSPLGELPIQYADFAVWQREWLQGEVLERQIGYWREQLADLRLLKLPTDHSRPPVQTYSGAYQFVEFDEELSAALTELGHREEATLFMTILAAFGCLLHKYAGQDDIVVGAPVAGRNRAEVEELIGFFVNTLVMRVRLSGQTHFRSVIRGVRGMALGAYAHQDVPFEILVEHLHPERDLSRNPLFQVTFQLYTTTFASQAQSESDDPPLEIKDGSAIFDLALNLWAGPEAIKGQFVYNTDLFEPATVGRMSGHLICLLRAGAANPDERICDLAILGETERRQLLIDWACNRVEYSQQQPVQVLFEEQAEQVPDAIAASIDNTYLSYDELDKRSNQLARYLIELGVELEQVVGVCAERGPELVLCLLGVLKAGAAYLPLDPTYPVERLAYMLSDAETWIVLTQQRLLEVVASAGLRTISIDGDWSDIARQDRKSLAPRATAQTLAYVIYTSGSTGAPKGVEIGHAGLVNLCAWHRQTYKLTPADRATELAGLAFDASVWEVWPYLISGASVHALSEGGRSLPEDLLSWMAHEAITISFLPTPVAECVIRLKMPEEMSLRALLTGGDKLLAGPDKRVQFGLFNHYGPTENTVVATCQEVNGQSLGMRTPPIGRPIANTETYILGQAREPLPIGVGGEICIGGIGLARGYRGQPALTAEKFIPHPYSEKPGARLYRTGDLGRYLAAGNIEFMGRTDRQLKIRGYRIEPGEIEAAIAGHPSINRVAVRGVKNSSEDIRLVAYIENRNGASPTPGDFRDYLLTKLPEHMVPSAFVVLDEMPVTPNGKIDIDSLPEEIPLAVSEASYVSPQTQLERTIAAVWREVLAVDRVGINDNYFELGGHSILMVQVHARLKNLLNRELSITDLFRYPTVCALAKHLSADDVEEPGRSHILERARRQKEARTRRDRVAKARLK